MFTLPSMGTAILELAGSRAAGLVAVMVIIKICIRMLKGESPGRGRGGHRRETRGQYNSSYAQSAASMDRAHERYNNNQAWREYKRR